MKIIILILTLLGGGLISFGQSTSSSLTQSTSSQQQQEKHPAMTPVSNDLGDVASLQKDISPLGAFVYTFLSDKILESGKIDRWTSRLKQHFSQAIDLELISSTQIVVVTLSNTHSDQDLLEIVQWFNFLNYSIAE